jgi:hypothetical protein
MAVYMATHIEPPKPPFNYIVPVCVGEVAAINPHFGVIDATGDSISERNQIYSELTALYWIWKNTSDDFVGLCHYRRFFDVEENDLRDILSQGKIIVPVGNRLKWTIEQQFARVHKPKIWTQTLKILFEMHPQYGSTASRVFSGNLMCSHNMFIANREFFESYCAFLFPVLFELEKAINQYPEDHEPRYAGFVSERLFTLYVLGNNISRTEINIIDAVGARTSPGATRRFLNNAYFRMFGQ